MSTWKNSLRKLNLSFFKNVSFNGIQCSFIIRK